MSTDTSIRLAPATLPRVNLLPPEIADERRFRTVQIALGGLVVASIVAVGGIFALSMQQKDHAQQQLEASHVTTAALNGQIGKYANVPAVYAQLDTAQTAQTAALSPEIQWSYVLNNLALKMTPNVWFTSLTVAEPTDGTTIPRSSGSAVSTPDGVATVTVAGVAYDYPDIAAWMDGIGKLKGFGDPQLQTATTQGGHNRTVVTYTGTASVNAQALSHRYTTKAGS